MASNRTVEDSIINPHLNIVTVIGKLHPSFSTEGIGE